MRARTSDVLPAPDGAAITNSRPRRLASSVKDVHPSQADHQANSARQFFALPMSSAAEIF